MKTRYIPQGYTPYTPDIGDYPKDMFAVYVKLDDPKRLSAIFYTGKQSNHTWFYGFPRLDDMKAKINDTISRLMSWQDAKAKRKDARSKPHTIKLGDIFYTSWGYDQTNIDFYQTTKIISDRTIEVRQIGSKIVDSSDISSNQVVAVKDSFLTPRGDGDKTGLPMVKRVSNNTIKITSYANGWLWDGTSKRETSFGFGH